MAAAHLERNKTHTLLIFGDSNTWGFDPAGAGRIPRSARWAVGVERILADKGVRVVEMGLNARTWVVEDPIGPCGGEYSCSGRTALLPILHSVKPVSLVVLALGCNDCKSHFGFNAMQIAEGARVLVRDVLKSTECGVDGGTPQILLLGPPLLQCTPTSEVWGFVGCEEKSAALGGCYAKVATEENVHFLDLARVAAVSPLDGIHFSIDVQAALSTAVADAAAAALGL